MDNEAQILLDDVIAFCQRDGLGPRMVGMLSQCRAVELTDEALYIEAPSRFAIAQIEKNRTVIEAYLEQIVFAPVALVATAPEGAAGTVPPVATSASPAQAPLPQAGMAPAAGEPGTGGLPWETPAAQQHAASTDGTQAQAAPAAPTAQAAPVLPAPNRAAVPIASSKDPGTVTVKNRLTREELDRIMGKGAADAHAPAAAVSSAPVSACAEAEEYPAVPVNSKFTFANFVYGDENKHAYHSAQRFAAFADEPGQYNSLFIYGSSGLGKTHLLLAIKNYLAAEKPQIRVKYANSQAYIDDFINEIARQKTEGRAILREYHDADVLIIDDIQNIIGKQASIEYFFSLMDEFIRENKKVVIASDRAPKKLGMDERLTSRFNAGMLCLVSEPGFEMKYAIMRRYYEALKEAQKNADTRHVDPSLIDAMPGKAGTLTDAQLRHMADIGGNNIRELESFCERCATLSGERENVGGELSAADIEEVAEEYFDTARRIIRIATVQQAVEGFYNVSHDDLIGPKRSKDIAFARHVAVYLANAMCDLSSSAIGAEFGGRDHSTVLNSLKVVESKMREDRRMVEDLSRLKSMITMKS